MTNLGQRSFKDSSIKLVAWLTMNINYISCFCTEKIPSGNPAAVIEEFKGDDREKQALATQLNLPVTVFVTPLENKFLFRFFYPLREMPLCIHGALAAAFVLMNKSNLLDMKAITGEQKELLFSKKGSTILLGLEQGKILPFQCSSVNLSEMIGVSQNEVDKDFPYVVASIGSPKLLIPLANYQSLAELKPNFSFIRDWSLESNVNGLYVYTQDTRVKGIDFIARGFNPKGGSDEDAATGVAAGALFTALGFNSEKEICIQQGEFIQQPSRIVVTGHENNLFIGGVLRQESDLQNKGTKC